MVYEADNIGSVYRKFPWRKFPIYLVAQVLGAFCASGVVYGTLIQVHLFITSKLTPL